MGCTWNFRTLVHVRLDEDAGLWLYLKQCFSATAKSETMIESDYESKSRVHVPRFGKFDKNRSDSARSGIRDRGVSSQKRAEFIW